MAIGLLSLAIFIASLTQDAIVYDDFDGQKTHASISPLFMGGFAILGGGLFEWLIWFANPIYLLSVILFVANKQLAIATSIVATLIRNFISQLDRNISGRKRKNRNHFFTGTWILVMDNKLVCFDNWNCL